MTISTNFNFNFTTSKTIIQENKQRYTALIQPDQRRKKIRRNEEFYNLTSSNISEIAKRK